MTLIYLVLWFATIWFGVDLIRLLRDRRIIETKFDYYTCYLAMHLIACSFFLMADRELGRPSKPTILHYAPDHVQIDYK